ncbi:Dual specificity protein phosphatase [Globisporangium polare]
MKRKPSHVASRAIEFLPRRFFFVALRETQKLSLHQCQPGGDRVKDSEDENGPRFPATPGIQYISLNSQLAPADLEGDSSELQRTVRFGDFLAGFLNSSSSGSCSSRIPGSSRELASSSRGPVYYFYLRRRSEEVETQVIHLICRWRLLHLQLTPQEAIAPFEHLEFLFPAVNQLRFGLSPQSPCSHPNLLTSLLGTAKGLGVELLGSTLDDLRLHTEQHKTLSLLANGAMTWITKRLLVFAGPQDPEPAPDATRLTAEDTAAASDQEAQAQTQAIPTAKTLVLLLKQQQVALVVRLSRQCYEESHFTESGVEVVDLSSPPPAADAEGKQELRPSSVDDSVLLRFLDACESTNGTIAVHSSANGGRAALFTGCYLMKHLQFTSQEAFGWLHLCCNGSLSPTHRLALDRLQPRMWRDGDAFRRLVMREANAAAVHPTASSSSSSAPAMDEFLKSSGSLQINVGNISLGRNSLFGTKASNAGEHSGPRTTNSSRELPLLSAASDGENGHQYQYQSHHPQQPSSASSSNANAVPQQVKRRPLTQGSNGRHPRLQSFYRNGEGSGGMLRADFAQMHKFLHQTGGSVATTPRSVSGSSSAAVSTNGSALASTSDGHLPSVHTGETARRSPAPAAEIEQ